MKLRKWQNECVTLALNKYASNNQHFLCLATPGAGKTTMAAEVAAHLFEENLIDFVLCFSPSIIISNDIRHTLEQRTNKRFDGLIGAGGGSFTYQGMSYLNSKIWTLLKSHRVFVIFDEIHHCSGTTPENANAWGEEVIANIQHQAAYTLALTGTPWRSDNMPIALAEYQGADNHILCDYAYGLADAIQDKVCRTPQIVVTDNNDISIQEVDGTFESFRSFSELLDKTPCPYQKIVENETVIRHIISQANNKLTQIRKKNSSAGGLVVASNVEHAAKIMDILRNELNVSVVIATYRENEPTTIIKDFKDNSIPWIVSVGMISEGTNIPRLQVCCHLTRIKTELHFRQTLGRILRITNSPNQDACLFMPAEKTLIEYACRVAEDIPNESAVVRFEKSKAEIFIDEYSEALIGNSNEEHNICYQVNIGENNNIQYIEPSPSTLPNQASLLTQSYEATLNVFGRFHQDILAVNISPFD
jgi:superfamily II DNA or RNA helicase